MSRRAVSVAVDGRQKRLLKGIAKAAKTPQQLAERARIVLLSSTGRTNQEVAEALQTSASRVSRWRFRWAAAHAGLEKAGQDQSAAADLRKMIVDVLSDERRSGAPAKFSAEQISQIIAMACEFPEDSELPISHWTAADLARQAIRRGIVENISRRHVRRFFEAGCYPAAQNAVLAQPQDRRS